MKANEGNNNEDKELTNPNAFFEHIQESEKNLNEMKSKNEEETKKAKEVEKTKTNTSSLVI